MISLTLKSLREEAIKEFCAITEFQAFTVLSYHDSAKRLERKEVSLKGMKLCYSDFASHLGIEDLEYKPEEVPKLFTSAGERYLFGLVLQHQIGLFEHYFFEVVRILLIDNPKRMPAQKKIDYKSVAESDNLYTLINTMAEREINSLKYKKPIEWFEFLQSLVSKCKVENIKIERIAEAKAARDILAHNQGIVNKTYIEKSGSSAKYTLNNKIKLTSESVRENWVDLLSVLLEIIDKLLVEFPEKEL